MAVYSLLLNEKWDLTLDGRGYIATTYDAYAVAQAVAYRLRAFYHDMYYNWNAGIPHFVDELGTTPNFTLIRSRIRERALEVDGVADVEIILDEDAITARNRVLTGDVRLTLADGQTVTVEL